MEATEATREARQQELQRLLKQDTDTLIETLSEMPTVEVAEFLTTLKPKKRLELFERFNPQQQAYIFTDFSEELQRNLVRRFPTYKIAWLLTHMFSDDRVDLFQQLPVKQQQALLPYLSKPVRDDITHLKSYPEETAGSVMSSDFATISDQMTVAKAIEKIRKDAPSKETVYYIYVVDKDMQLIGFVSLKDLILSAPDEKIAHICKNEFIYGNVLDDQERVLKDIEKYDLIAIPIVNDKQQLVGIVTHDDAMDILRQEQTEDMEKFMGIGGPHQNYTYLRLSSWEHYKNRITWLAGLALLGVCSAFIIQQFEETIETFIILALYLPLLIDSGGNSGGQAATVVVRALALGELTGKKWLEVLWKELRISLLLCVTLALLTFGIVMALSSTSLVPEGFSLSYVALVISIALAIQVLTATLLGSLIPLLAKRLNIDPAIIASPAITTLVDITGLLIYFSVAHMMLLD